MPHSLKRSILIVDDDADSRSLLRIFARQIGYLDIQSAVSGEEAFDQLSKRSFGIILSDLRMPTMDGVELLVKTRAAKMNTIFILYTSAFTRQVAKDAETAGANFVVAKSNNLKELREILAQNII